MVRTVTAVIRDEIGKAGVNGRGKRAA